MNDTCFIDADLLALEQALKKILLSVPTLKGCEQQSLKNALGRVLAKPVFAPIDIPPERNAAMDGYAFTSTDIKSNQAFSLTQIGISWAGQPFKGVLGLGECVRIFTGAVMPVNADSVIMQEWVTVKNKRIYFPNNWLPFDNIRQAGSDIQHQACLLNAGKKLTATDLGLLASAGIHSIDLKRKLRLAYFSTGDELVALGQPLKSGQIYDSNRYILHGLFNDPCIEAVDMGVIGDDKMLLEQALSAATKHYDILITTGGASVGDADYIKEILEKLGQVNFWKIAMKPGKPVAFGHIGDCTFFGLPGNPVSVIVTFDKIVKPALRKLTGLKTVTPLKIKAVCQSVLKKAAGREDYQRGILTQQADGTLTVTSAGEQDSNRLSTMSRANCYMVLPANCTKVEINEEIWTEPFNSFF